jgi:hypothetical protein
MLRTCALLLSVGLALGGQPSALPSFDQFRVTQVFSGKPANPVLRTADDRMFRTKIRDGAKDGPNFAGHYTIAAWGCGAGCVQMALIDAVDGQVYRAPFKVLSWELMRYEGKIASNDDHFEELDFHKDSRLLIARGCPEEKNCASYFYELSGTRFKLLLQVAATRLAPQ